MKKRFIILLGAPGSGKGTQSSLLTSKFKIPNISTGDLIRKEIKESTRLGTIMDPYISRGDLVPDDLIISLFSNITNNSLYSNGFISDGFPRTLSQAIKLDKLFTSIHNSNSFVFLLDINIDFLLDRLLGRLICTKCNAIYHNNYSPPNLDNTCVSCNTVVTSRQDDNKEVIVNRNKIFINQINPVIDYYSDRIIKIDANKSSQDVFLSIESFLNINT